MKVSYKDRVKLKFEKAAEKYADKRIAGMRGIKTKKGRIRWFQAHHDFLAGSQFGIAFCRTELNRRSRK